MRLADLRKILGILIASMVSVMSLASAMTFSQLEKIGRIYQSQAIEGWKIEGPTSNDGDFYRANNIRARNNNETFGKGIARFRELYVYS